jgi:hypothetical protein
LASTPTSPPPNTFFRRAFTIILTHYYDLRAFVGTFDINTYNDLPPSPRLRGYVNSFGIKVYSTSNHFGATGSSTTLVWTSTSTTMTMLTTLSVADDLVTSASQEG